MTSGEQAGQAGDAIRCMIGIHAQDTTSRIQERLAVAQCLRDLEHAERHVRRIGVRGIRDRNVGGGWGGDDLDEHAVTTVAFVQLPR